MSDMLADGMAWLAGRMRASAATPVRYARGGVSAVVPAVLGKKLLRIEDLDGGVRYEHTDLDLVIAAADLVLAGEPVTPLRGDRAYVGGDGGTAIYEVFPVGGEAPWRWCDPHRKAIRVHLKFVEWEARS